MNDAAALLQELGFGEYEAKAYVALLQRSPLNGYELAKASGVPRPNIYSVLQKLEERGAVLRVEADGGTRYTPVPPAQLTQSLSSRFQATLEATQGVLNDMAVPIAQEYVLNARGYAALVEQTTVLIEAARKEVLIALWPDEATALARPLARADERGLSITTLCLTACTSECSGCRGGIYRYRVAPEPRHRWLVLVTDGEEMLAGEIGPGDETQAVRTRQRLVVDVAQGYIRHTIALAAVLDDLEGQTHSLLPPPTRATLQAVAGAQPGGGWLEMIRQVADRHAE